MECCSFIVLFHSYYYAYGKSHENILKITVDIKYHTLN